MSLSVSCCLWLLVLYISLVFQLGIMLPGSVKNLVSYGIFIEFPGGMVGLVPRQVGDYLVEIHVALSLFN